ncbi:Circadian input kinase A, partial [uncultured Microcoleus sp.]
DDLELFKSPVIHRELYSSRPLLPLAARASRDPHSVRLYHCPGLLFNTAIANLFYPPAKRCCERAS